MPNPLSPPPSATPRLVRLDALRGCACMAVVFGHCLLSAPADALNKLQGTLWVVLLRLFTNGDAAVIVFFLLSGYVLAKPFLQKKKPGYGRFLFRRMCRLYIPYAVAIILSAWLVRDVSAPLDGGSPWLNFHDGLTAAAWLPGHFLTIGRTQDMSADGVIWTLIHEMRVALIFPLLVLLCRDTRAALLTAAIILVGSTKLLAFYGAMEPWAAVDTFGISMLWTLRVIPYFLVGILLCKHTDAIRRFLVKIRGAGRCGMFVFVLLVLIFPHSYMNIAGDVCFILAAVCVIMLPFELRWLGWILDRRVLRGLGDISYSIYLIHTPILMAMVHALWGHASYAAIIAAFLVVMLAAASIMRAAVELPAMELGRRLDFNRRKNG